MRLLLVRTADLPSAQRIKIALPAIPSCVVDAASAAHLLMRTLAAVAEPLSHVCNRRLMHDCHELDLMCAPTLACMRAWHRLIAHLTARALRTTLLACLPAAWWLLSVVCCTVSVVSFNRRCCIGGSCFTYVLVENAEQLIADDFACIRKLFRYGTGRLVSVTRPAASPRREMPTHVSACTSVRACIGAWMCLRVMPRTCSYAKKDAVFIFLDSSFKLWDTLAKAVPICADRVPVYVCP